MFLLSNTTANTNNWTGGLLIDTVAAANTITGKLGADNQIPDGAGAGNVILTGSGTQVLNLNGHSDTINGLVSGSGTNTVTDGGTAASTLTFGAGDVSTEFDGSVIDSGLSSPLSLVKTGTGTQTFRRFFVVQWQCDCQWRNARIHQRLEPQCGDECEPHCEFNWHVHDERRRIAAQ